MDGWCSLPHQPDALEMVCSRLVCAFMTTPHTLGVQCVSAVRECEREREREREHLPRGFSSSPSPSRLHRAGPSTQLQLCPRGTSCQRRPLRTDTVRPVGLLCGACTARLSRYRSAFLAAACLRSSARCRESCSTADENDSPSPHAANSSVVVVHSSRSLAEERVSLRPLPASLPAVVRVLPAGTAACVSRALAYRCPGLIGPALASQSQVPIPTTSASAPPPPHRRL
jgi:hypothetical protein